jgi:TolB-like protein
MKNKVAYFAIGLAAVVSALLAPARADLLKTPGTAAAPFLKIGSAARAQALGGNFAGLADDVSAVEYNPAGLAGISAGAAALSHVIWFNDVTLDSVIFGTKSGNSAYGFNGTLLRAVDYARAKVENAAADTAELVQGEEILQQNTLAAFTYARSYDGVNFGISAKYIGQQLYKNQAAAAAADLGLLFKSRNGRTGYGISLLNIGTTLGGDPLPACARFGIGHKEDGLNVSLDAAQFIDSKIRCGAGMEIFFGRTFILRGAGNYQQEFFITGGFGFDFGSVKLDYAYLPHTGLGQAHRVSMLIAFGAKAKPAKRGQSQKARTVPSQTRPPLADAAAAKSPKKTPAAVKEKSTVAVADFAAKNVSGADASIASDFLRTELVNSGVFTVMDRKNMEIILAEQNLQASGCTEQECAVKMGKILNVKKVIIGSYAKYGNHYVVTVNMVSVETGEITKSFGQEFAVPEGLREACKVLALKLSL